VQSQCIHQYDRESLKHHPISTTINWLPTNDLRIIRPKVSKSSSLSSITSMVELKLLPFAHFNCATWNRKYYLTRRFNPNLPPWRSTIFFAMVPAPVPPPYLLEACRRLKCEKWYPSIFPNPNSIILYIKNNRLLCFSFRPISILIFWEW